jgi:hypothetical protein
VKPPGRDNGEPDKNSQERKLRDEKWRLVPFWSQCMQSRQLEEHLRYKDKAVEVKSDHGTDYIYAAPGTLQAPGISREDGNCQYQQGKNTDHMGRQEVSEGEEESRQAGEHSEQQKGRSPAVEPLSGHQPIHYDESGSDAHQAYYHVEESEGR